MSTAQTKERALLAKIVTAYDVLADAEIDYGTKPGAVEAAREALEACIDDAKKALGIRVWRA